MSKANTHNFDSIKKSAECGCTHCLKIYPATEVVSWDDNGKTALCPYCGLDFVLGDHDNDVKTVIARLEYDKEKHKR